MKKNKTKIIIGWILIVLQCFAVFSRIINGSPFPEGIAGFFNILGFFSFGIVGAILLILGYNQKIK
jgi:hypothetical protein